VFEYTWEDVMQRTGYVERTFVSRLDAAGWSR